MLAVILLLSEQQKFSLFKQLTPPFLYFFPLFRDKKSSEFSASHFLLASGFVSASGRWFASWLALGPGRWLLPSPREVGTRPDLRRVESDSTHRACIKRASAALSAAAECQSQFGVGVERRRLLDFSAPRLTPVLFLCVVQSEMRNTPVLGHSSEAPCSSSPAATTSTELSSPLAASDQTPPLRTVRRTRLSDKALGQYHFFIILPSVWKKFSPCIGEASYIRLIYLTDRAVLDFDFISTCNGF